MKKKVFIVLLMLLSFGLILAKNHSITPVAQAQTCSAPVTPSGVNVDYPGCSGGSCNLTQASCSWTLQGDAASYNVTVTEVETGTIIKNNENQSGTTSSIVFPITQQRTYKCDVTAVAVCGTASAAASDQLLCDADAILDTPTPSPTAVQADVTIPPKAVTPTIASPGGLLETVGILGGVTLVIFAGIMLFVL